MKDEFEVHIERMRGLTVGDGILYIEVTDSLNNNTLRLNRGSFRSQTKAIEHAKTILELARETI